MIDSFACSHFSVTSFLICSETFIKVVWRLLGEGECRARFHFHTSAEVKSQNGFLMLHVTTWGRSRSKGRRKSTGAHGHAVTCSLCEGVVLSGVEFQVHLSCFSCETLLRNLQGRSFVLHQCLYAFHTEVRLDTLVGIAWNVLMLFSWLVQWYVSICY